MLHFFQRIWKKWLMINFIAEKLLYEICFVALAEFKKI